MNSAKAQAPGVALITGSARRIGAAIAKTLHAQGFTIAIHCRNSLNEANVLAAELNGQRQDSAKVFQADLCDVDAIRGLITEVIEWQGQLNVLVNNASSFYQSDIASVDEAHWDELFNANAKAPFFLSQQSFPHLNKNNGSIINITDIHAQSPLKAYSVYCMSKAALELQTKALAREFAPHVRVNAVAPGAIAWPEGQNTMDEKTKNAVVNKTPLKKHGEPQYIAQAVSALLDNPFITGQSIAIDGGRSL